MNYSGYIIKKLEFYMGMKFFKSICFLVFIPLFGFSQEVITDLSVNFQQKEMIKSFKKNEKIDRSGYVFLPFKDDFSKETVFPSQDLWENNFAFINNTFPIKPITVGVATLDALNDSGMIYTHANSSSFIADYLTTQHIRLDSVYQGSNLFPVNVGDSLYLSFYFQPQGIGNKPEGQDSLVLEFYSPKDSLWHWIWSSAGMSYQDFHTAYNVDFKQVMIPVTDSLLYFRKDFQFRFFNYASIANTYEPSWAGNVDQWHLDYVYLNTGRTINDTIYEDVAFTDKPKSLLTKYQSVPWPHYSNSVLMNASEELPYVNLSDITKNVSRKFSIIDKYDDSEAFAYSGGNLNLSPFTIENFSAPVSYTFTSSSTDTALFELRSIINTTPDVGRNNDTIRFIQRFNNYYAYDDGTPENGYGLTTTSAKLAYKFTASQPDTLKVIQMFFNQTYQNANQKYFYLTVWSGTTQPDQVIYEKQGISPIFEDELNKYHNYDIDTTLVLSGTFFIGWRQTTADNLNIGFDRNTNSKENIFYNVNGTWMNSMYDGSLMIRPVFGKMFNTSINDIDNKEEKLSFTAYPNPLNSNILNFRPSSELFNDYGKYALKIVDFLGKVVLMGELENKIDIPENISNGLYFYVITRKNDGSPLDTGKFIISR